MQVMKKISIILFATIILIGCKKEEESTYYGNVVLTTQEELDEFGSKNYETINGNLQIGVLKIPGVEIETDIVYDKALSDLKRIEGDLIIQNTSLHWIEGLKNLEYIGGEFNFSFNDRIKKLEGLTNILYLGGNLTIKFNDRLETIDKFEYISSIFGDLSISFSGRTLDFLGNIKLIAGDLILYGVSFINLNGLDKLESIGGSMEIERCWGLENLDGLSNLRTVSGSISITWNKNLDNFCGLSNVLKEFENTYYVHSNKYNPSKEDILAGNCSLD